MVIERKLETLREHLASYKKMAVAFSGGVDSTFLLTVAHEALGANVCAVTARSIAFPEREHLEAVEFCNEHSIRQIVFDAEQFNVEGFKKNLPDRCYHCKQALFTHMLNLTAEHNLGILADGSNIDDLSDYRPGHQALRELGIESPLVACDFSKQDVREASRLLGLPTADKPSFACLATRFPYGKPLTPEGLKRVDTMEKGLLELGLSTVRVRSIDNEARIEVLPNTFSLVLDTREAILAMAKEAGFTYVALDLQGYRSGSMNEGL